MLTELTRKADINESGRYKVQKAKTVNLTIFFSSVTAVRIILFKPTRRLFLVCLFVLCYSVSLCELTVASSNQV